jgi:hypothetical protein
VVDHIDLAVGATATIYEEVSGEWGWAGSDWGSRFVVVLYPHPWSPALLGAVVLGDGTTLGSTATVEDVRDVRRVVRTWKSAHSYPAWVYVLHDPSIAMLGVAELGAVVLGYGLDSVARWPVGCQLGEQIKTLSGQPLGSYFS